MTKVCFYVQGEIDDALLAFAVIVCRYKGRFLYCRHKERDTYEVPGGHREFGESILDAAHRELFEETGATAYRLFAISVYGIKKENMPESFGMLYYAEIEILGRLPESEICEIYLDDGLPEKLTYPDMQPALMKKAKAFMKQNSIS